MLTIKEQLKQQLDQMLGMEQKFSIEYPGRVEYGDYSTNAALLLGKKEGKNPREVAEAIVKKLKENSFVKTHFIKVEVAGAGFINFFLKDEVLLAEMDKIREEKEGYGQNKKGKGNKVLIEYSSPNTNKPLHLGHLRNNFIGMSLGNILENQGYDVKLTEIVNDRGIHICKSMLAYKLWGQDDSPEKSGLKGDHFVGKYYVLYAKEEKKNPEILEQAREMLRQWEAGGKNVRQLWQKMNTWAEAGYAQTYEKIGSHFDFKDYESRIYNNGREIVDQALAEGRAKKIEGGAVAVDLAKHNLGSQDSGEKVLVRSDGTTMYITQDLYLAVKRWEKYKPEQVLYVVGDEQLYHFKVLFKILELFGYEWVKNRYYHVAYGHVNLPEGRMKSREGTVVDADDLILQMEDLAREEIKKRDKELEQGELNKRAEKVALAALKFFILKVDTQKSMLYNPKASIDFEGDTGPYLLYTYARLNSILRKGGEPAKVKSISMNDEERNILAQALKLTEVVERAAEEHKPHYISDYLLSFASLVNSWYARNPVLQSEGDVKNFRLCLVAAASSVVKNGLRLLNIETLEEM